MGGSIFTFFSGAILVIYMAICSLYSQEFKKIQRDKQRMKTHFTVMGILAAGGLLIFFMGDFAFKLGSLYLLMPLVYLIFIKLTSKWMHVKYGRPVIMANNINMQKESTKDANFWDYLFFFVIHIVPVLLPLLIYETILGYPL